MQTAMLLTWQKPTQTDRAKESDCQLLTSDSLSNGEVREGLPGSTLERGMREEKRPGTWETLLAPEHSDVETGISHGIRLVSPHTAKA